MGAQQAGVLRAVVQLLSLARSNCPAVARLARDDCFHRRRVA